MESDPLKSRLAAPKYGFWAIGVGLEGARFHGPKQSENLPPSLRSSAGQDSKPLTEEIAKLPDSSLRAQVFVQIQRMKSSNDMDGFLQARCARVVSIQAFPGCILD